jgi:ABC-type multidrug transport system ATPase subunit
MMEQRFGVETEGDFSVTIGSASYCDIVIKGEAIDSVHVVLSREGDRLFVRHCTKIGTSRLTLADRVLDSPRTVEILSDEVIEIGNFEIDCSAVSGGRPRMSLKSTPLVFSLSGNYLTPPRILIDHLFINAEKGSFTALMGPSGCGKSVFLHCLSGKLQPQEGKVFLNETFDVHRNRLWRRDKIGLVPQDDVLIPELTVSQSLHHVLKLQYPDMSRHMRNQKIHQVCLRLGFEATSIPALLKTRIGNAEKRGLSGGQRKRLNIAQELITGPVVLLLDEPTSGLSSSDANGIIDLLYRLSHEEGLTVVATIHQPSQRSFYQFDDLLLLHSGGRLAYYGPVDQCRTYLAQCGFPLNEMDSLPEQLIAFSSMDFQGPPFLPGGDHQPLMDPIADKKAKTTPVFLLIWKVWLNFWGLLLRQGSVFLSDRANLSLFLLQIPLIAFLIVFSFWGYEEDERQFDQFARRTFLMRELMDRHQKFSENYFCEVMEPSEVMPVAGYSAELTAQRKGSVWFLLVAASIWFGVLGSSREIVTEQAILDRESRRYVYLISVLSSKFVHQCVLLLLQTGGLLFMVNRALWQYGSQDFIGLWMILWLSAATASALGLLISAWSTTMRTTLTMVPLVVIPQLLFGGMLRPLEAIPESSLPSYVEKVRWAQSLTPQNWGFKAGLDFLGKVDGPIVLEKQVNDWPCHAMIWEKLQSISFHKRFIADLYYPEQSPFPLSPIRTLGLMTLSLLVLSYLLLRLRF